MLTRKIVNTSFKADNHKHNTMDITIEVVIVSTLPFVENLAQMPLQAVYIILTGHRACVSFLNKIFEEASAQNQPN